MTAEAPLPTGSDGWLEHARRRVEATPAGASTASYGEVVQLADGIVRIAGLPEVRLDELVRFESGQLGLVLALEEDALNAVLLDEPQGLEAGTRVTGTGAVVRVPVGPALMGRIVDPLGRPLDDKGDIAAAEHWPIERPSPAIIERDLVSRPVETGISRRPPCCSRATRRASPLCTASASGASPRRCSQTTPAGRTSRR